MVDETTGTILIVDDTEVNRYTTGHALRRAGFTVVEAVDGADGLRRAAEKPDLIILDVKLPDLDGVEVCRRLKADPVTAMTPVLHLSASQVLSNHRAAGLESGADGYLARPVEPRELVANVRSLLRLRRAEAAARNASRQWQATFDAINDGVALLDQRGVVARCNRALAELAGASTQDLVGRTIDELFDAPLGDEPSPFKEMVKRGSRAAADFPASSRRLHATCDPIFDDQGRLANAVYIVADVTERRKAEEERRRLASIVENSFDFISIADLAGQLLYVNGSGKRLVGLRDDDAVRRSNVLDCFSIDDRGFVRDHVLPAVWRAGRWTGEVQFQHFESSVSTPVFWDVFRIDDPKTGRPMNLAVVARDLTESKLARSALRDSDERVRMLINHASDYAVIITDAEGRIVEWLAGAERIIGWSEAEVRGEAIDLLFIPEDRAAGAPAAEIARTTRDGRTDDRRWHQRKDESRFFADGVTTVLKDDSGRLRGFGKVLRDATEAKLAQEAIRKQNTRLRIFSEGAADLLSADSRGVVHGLYERAAQHLGLDAYLNYMVDESGGALRLDSYAGLSDAAATRIERLDFGESACGSVALSGEPLTADHVQQSTSPQLASLRSLGVRAYTCHPLIVDNRLIGTLAFATRGRDEFDSDEIEFLRTVTRHVALFQDRVRLMSELRERADRLAEADERKDEFLATLAHELRNPLAPIRNAVEVLQRDPMDPADQTVLLSMINRQVVQLVRLVDDLLDVSRITRGKIDLRKERLNLADVIHSAVETSRSHIEKAGHRLRLDLPAEPIVLTADPTRLAQALANLLINAAKYTPAGGRIEVFASAKSGEAVVRVEDDGIGIPPEMLKKVFEPFTQIDQSIDRSQGGLGIGLTLVRRLIELHDGGVSAFSAGPGRGSVFTVRLPLALQDDAPPAEAHGSPVDGAAAAAAGGPRRTRILVVDDNIDATDSLTILLEMWGYEVCKAYDGGAALAVADRFRPEVVLLDIGLPGLSGHEVAKSLRETYAADGMLLIALTGWGQDADRRKSQDAGFDHHLTKPVNPDVLSRLLATPASQPPPRGRKNLPAGDKERGAPAELDDQAPKESTSAPGRHQDKR